MTVQSNSPSLLRKQLGRRFRSYRDQRGETLADVAKALEVHPSVISRLETGKRSPGMVYVDALCRHYELDESDRDEIVQIARDSLQSGWWESYKLADASRNYIEWEAAAVAIRNFEIAIVPGLLQTADYASAIFAAHPDSTRQRLSTEVKARLKRQEILDSSGFRLFHAILDESVLMRRVGGNDTMRGQLRKLIAVVEHPRVTLQILPFEAGVNPGLNGSFVLLDFDDETDNLVYEEGTLGALYQADAADVAQTATVFRDLTEIAADRAGSLTLIEQALNRF
jgi:transcriptional regulator with XRE-family HTH domain